MTYRVYIRTFNQTVLPETRTNTNNSSVAEQAFRALMLDRQYWAKPLAAVLSLQNRQLEFRRFDRMQLIDPALDKRLRHKEPLPDKPRLLLDIPADRATWEAAEDPDRDYIACVLIQSRDAIIVDDSPIQLFPED